MASTLGEIFLFDQRVQTEPSLGSAPNTAQLSEDIHRALAAAHEAAYKWTIATDEIVWSDNAPEILGCAMSKISSGKLFAGLLDFDNFTNRYETVMNSKTRDNGNGVPYHIEYMFRSSGRGEANTIWIEDQGRWHAGPDGNPKVAYGTIRGIDDRHRKDQHLNFLGNCDPLTGMMNRGRMTEALGEAISVSIREKRECAFAIASVNNLSVVNEAYGFDVADEVIVALGRKLRQVMRAGDGIARFSGGKFGIILNECNEPELRTAIERLLSVSRDSVIETQHGPVWAMLSIGAICLPNQATDANTATARAEEALNEAVRLPSDGYVIYKPSERRSNERALNARCATDIVKCLKEDRFKLAFQPIVDARSSEIAMHEALLRMADTTSGELIAASHLVPISENLGLVRLIDRSVMQMIIKTLNTYPDSKLAMNVSGTTAMDMRWYSQLLEILEANPHVTSRLVVEITETVALSNVPSTRKFVDSLRELGCGVAIDDFGAGFTSFRNLRDLPVNMIKLDGSFCQNLKDNNENQYIVRSLIDLAGKFKIKTVAEWIETEEDADLLKSWGIDFMQGHLLGEATITVPWVANKSSVFSLETKETATAVVKSTIKQTAVIEDNQIVVTPETAFHQDVDKDELAPMATISTAPSYSEFLQAEELASDEGLSRSELKEPDDLDFSDIDISITGLRNTLNELQSYLSNKTECSDQEAA